MPPVSILIKPASSNCNLRCKYCFYHSISENRNIPSYGMMSDETLENLVEKALDYSEQSCTFAFQGGEPTLAGIQFYKSLLKHIEKHNKKKVNVKLAIQTNGIVIDEEWAGFFHDNSFLVGLSLDGYKDIHDLMRIDAQGKGTYSRVLKTVNLFNKHKVEYNILCVVNSYVARHINKVYASFKKSGFKYLQFIPCLDPLDEAPGNYEYSLTPEHYTGFLKTLFDEWYRDIINGDAVSIRYFDNLVAMAMGCPPESCGMSGLCTAYLVVEADGGIYPCDFYVFDRWHMGNIRELNFRELLESNAAKQFVASSEYVDPECKVCRWIHLCRGGCRRNREPFVDNRPSLNGYCSSYKVFFEYAYPRIMKLAQMFAARI